MKKILLFLMSVMMLVSCADEMPDDKHPRPAVSGRTMLAYMVANNNLDSDIMKNILGMYQGLCNAKDTCSLLVFYKPRIHWDPDTLMSSSNANISTPVIFKFESNGHGKINGKSALLGADLTEKNIMSQAIILREYPMDWNSLDPENISQALNFMVQDTPSETYGLVFGSHASSWLPAKNVVRAFGRDDMDKIYQINIPEMASALGEVFTSENLDFILWDACMMGTVEVAHELRNVTKYMIGSVMESPAKGFPYADLMDYFYRRSLEFRKICKTTINFFEESGWGTVAAFDCRKIENLATFVRSNRNMFDLDRLRSGKKAIQQYGVSKIGTEYFAFDVTDTFSFLNSHIVPDMLKGIMSEVVLAKECLSGIEYAYEGLVISEEKFSGTGMFIPILDLNKKWEDYYKTLSWCKAVEWGELMN